MVDPTKAAAGAEGPSFPLLCSPLTVGPLTLPNRIVMGAMHTRIETMDRPTERMVEFFRVRAAGGVGLILTGGHSPSPEGRMDPESPVLEDETDLEHHRAITDAVHAEGAAIVLQLLHAGRYAKVEGCVGPGEERARINPFAPRALTTAEVWELVDRYATSARLAVAAGYDGVELMGSEGYLLSQFLAPRTNTRTDEFGGDLDGRSRLSIEVTRSVRSALGPDRLLVYRISALDLVNGGLDRAETEELARRVVTAGAQVLNTGIGWHESDVPTIAAAVPRAAWGFATAQVKAAVDVPVIASNRINTPAVAEELLGDGTCDLVSMARPLLADPDFAAKAGQGRDLLINTCIACNQACLDRIFSDDVASCLVNPRAGHELEFPTGPAATPKRVAVVGAGPAGATCAIEAARRGHRVSLYEASDRIGGQLHLAKVVPGKAEFNELLRYLDRQLQALGVGMFLRTKVTAAELAGFDEIVVATGVTPRRPEIEGLDHPSVVSYADVLSGAAPVGERVAIMGAGGIGFDVAEFLLGNPQESVSPAEFLAEWGVDRRGGDAVTRTPPPGASSAGVRTAPQVVMLQRKSERMGRGLGKTTGWVLKARLRKAGVRQLSGVTYRRVDDDGLHVTTDDGDTVVAADTVVLCTGQDPNRALYDELVTAGLQPHLLGGADVAAELDAVRAIDRATRLAVTF